MSERMAQPRRTKILHSVGFYILAVVILLLVLFPLLWMLTASFKTNAQILNVKKMFSFEPTLKNYINVFVKYNFKNPILNSFIISFVSTILALILGLPAAYSIGRSQMHLFSGIILMIRIIPAISFLVPWYIMFSKLGLTGTYTALILCHLIVSLPLIIWITWKRPSPGLERIPASYSFPKTSGTACIGIRTIILPKWRPAPGAWYPRNGFCPRRCRRW